MLDLWMRLLRPPMTARQRRIRLVFWGSMIVVGVVLWIASDWIGTYRQ